MRIPIYQIDAFAERTFTGNPAAVCPLEEWLPDDLMQAIAEENNLAETAFYVPEGEGYRLRWFTPAHEVDLCGHATLATAHVIFAKTGDPALTQVTFQSRGGTLRVLRDGERLTLDFPIVPIEPCAIPPGLAEALGATPAECYRAADYVAVFDSEEQIRALEPDFRALKELDLRGVITTAPGAKADFVSRFFAPKYGIDEDPVTGSAHCALTPYWASRLEKSELNAQQLSQRGGHLDCRLDAGRVLISGKAVQYLEGFIEVSSPAPSAP